MGRPTLRLLARLLLFTAMAAAPASAGAADPKRGVCAGKLCLFGGTQATEERVNVTALGLSNRVAKRMDDQASSVFNDRKGVAFIYAKRDGKGAKICLETGDAFDDLSEVNFDNRASSTRLTNRKNCPT